MWNLHSSMKLEGTKLRGVALIALSLMAFLASPSFLKKVHANTFLHEVQLQWPFYLLQIASISLFLIGLWMVIRTPGKNR